MRIVGVDLGQEHDYASAAVLDRDDLLPPLRHPDAGEGTLRCLSLKRWERGTDYVRIAKDVAELSWDFCVPDFCGVGRPVVDVIRHEMTALKHRGRLFPVMTVGSQVGVVNVRTDRRGQEHATVPKIELVSSILIVKQRKLLALPNTPLTAVLFRELDDYRMRYSKAGNQQFGNADGPGKHDDIVSAVGLACWAFLNLARAKPSLWLAGQPDDKGPEIEIQQGADAAGPGALVVPPGSKGLEPGQSTGPERSPLKPTHTTASPPTNDKRLLADYRKRLAEAWDVSKRRR